MISFSPSVHWVLLWANVIPRTCLKWLLVCCCLFCFLLFCFASWLKRYSSLDNARMASKYKEFIYSNLLPAFANIQIEFIYSLRHTFNLCPMQDFPRKYPEINLQCINGAQIILVSGMRTNLKWEKFRSV